MFYKQRMNLRRWREKIRYLPVIIVAGAGIILSGITFKVMREDEDNKIQLDALETKVKTIFKYRRDKEMLLKADKALPYGLVIDVMACSQRGIDHGPLCWGDEFGEPGLQFMHAV